ncbi:MAG: type II secretion system protein M [Pseudomonadales bacterium]|nr:type II secretion system protein M [Pseudomonadales bacterium]
MNALTKWFGGLSERERLLVTMGAAAAIVLLLLAVVLPLNMAVAKASARVDKKRSDLAFIQSVAPEVAAAGPLAGGGTSAESLVVLIDRSARESGLGSSLASTQPSGDKSLRLRLDKASFDLLVGWLARLSDQHGVSVESAEIDGGGEPGLVNAGLVLRAR